MPTRDRLLAAVVAALWGANFLAIHVGLQHFPPLFLAALRFAVIALPTVLLVPRPQVRLRWLLGYGLGFGTLQFLFLFVAMDIGMPTGLASLVLQASAPFTVVLGAVLLRERLTPRQGLGIGLAVLGLAAIAVARAQSAALLPVLLTLAGALGWALGNLCSRWPHRRTRCTWRCGCRWSRRCRCSSRRGSSRDPSPGGTRCAPRSLLRGCRDCSPSPTSPGWRPCWARGSGRR